MKQLIHGITIGLLCIAGFIVGCSSPTKGAFLTVDNEQCIGCAECNDVCATKAIRMINNKAVIDPASCVECGKCVTICPKDAIF